MAQDTFLSPEERVLIEKGIAKNTPDSKWMQKLLSLHDLFLDSSVAEGIRVSTKFLETAKFASDNINEYMMEDTNDQVVIAFDPETRTPIKEDVPRKYSVLMNKSNGMPERLQSMQKIIADTVQDVMMLTRIYAKHANPDQTKALSETAGLSWEDKKNMRSGKTRGKKTNS